MKEMKLKTIAALMALVATGSQANSDAQYVFNMAHIHGYVTEVSTKICKNTSTPNLNSVRAKFDHILNGMDSQHLVIEGGMSGRNEAHNQLRTATMARQVSSVSDWCKKVDQGFEEYK